MALTCQPCDILQGQANLLLESYGAAEASFLAGLGIDPTDQQLLKGLQQAQKDTEANKTESNRHKR